MLSLDAAITLGGGKQPLNETKTQFGQAHFIRKPMWIHPQMGGGGGVYVKYWPSGGWAFIQTGALTRADTVCCLCIYVKLFSNASTYFVTCLLMQEFEMRFELLLLQCSMLLLLMDNK